MQVFISTMQQFLHRQNTFEGTSADVPLITKMFWIREKAPLAVWRAKECPYLTRQMAAYLRYTHVKGQQIYKAGHFSIASQSLPYLISFEPNIFTHADSLAYVRTPYLISQDLFQRTT